MAADTTESPTLYLMVGLPGSGKTTRSLEIEASRGALRLSPDEWLGPLFGKTENERARDVIEGRLIWLALKALAGGNDVILDFGFWSKEERDALRFAATTVGASCRLIYLEVDESEQRLRLERRYLADPAYRAEVLPQVLSEARKYFRVPDAHEFGSREPGPPPDGFDNWLTWMHERWPTSDGRMFAG